MSVIHVQQEKAALEEEEEKGSQEWWRQGRRDSVFTADSQSPSSEAKQGEQV